LDRCNSAHPAKTDALATPNLMNGIDQRHIPDMRVTGQDIP
jgi:hypothetical protein